MRGEGLLASSLLRIAVLYPTSFFFFLKEENLEDFLLDELLAAKA